MEISLLLHGQRWATHSLLSTSACASPRTRRRSLSRRLRGLSTPLDQGPELGRLELSFERECGCNNSRCHNQLGAVGGFQFIPSSSSRQLNSRASERASARLSRSSSQVRSWQFTPGTSSIQPIHHSPRRLTIAVYSTSTPWHILSEQGRPVDHRRRRPDRSVYLAPGR